MKPITQDRILDTLEKLLDRRDRRQRFATRKITSIVCDLKNILGKSYDVKVTSNRPYEIECRSVKQVIDLYPLNSEWVIFFQIQALSKELATRIFDIRNAYTIRRKRILDIQVKHNISGLEWKHVEPTFVTTGFSFPFFSKKLRPIARDLEILASYKGSVIQYWVDCASKFGLAACYMTDGVWIPITFDKVWEKSSGFDWADISLDEYYVSPSIIAATGCGKSRREPEIDDDELIIEFYLAIGRGLDFGGQNADTLNFMLVKETPVYC